MNKLEFRYLLQGNKFFYEGQEYTKTGHQRGYYYENGQIVHKRFKKKTIVESEHRRFDVE